jgi:enoyl-CoA hydratase/carnithine racemase
MTTTRLERDGGLAVLTLDNPPLNQISEQVVDDLVEVVAALEAADDVRALLVRGAGDVFSAGADVKLFAGRSAAEMRPLIERFLDLGRRVEALPFPTLAAVHGMCVAGGLELVLFLDLIWAADGTNLGLLETRIGIVPLAGGIERVAARAGLGRARSIALSGNLFPAEQFEAWGIVDRVLPADELQPQAEKFAQRLAAGPARAFAAVKQFAAAYTEGGVAAADERLLEDAVGLFDTDDARNGIESFLTSGPGKATFTGR